MLIWEGSPRFTPAPLLSTAVIAALAATSTDTSLPDLLYLGCPLPTPLRTREQSSPAGTGHGILLVGFCFAWLVWGLFLFCSFFPQKLKRPISDFLPTPGQPGSRTLTACSFWALGERGNGLFNFLCNLDSITRKSSRTRH